RGWRSCSRGSFVLINSVGENPRQQDEKQVRPFGNSLICSASSLRLRLGRPVGRAVIQCFNVAQFCVKFHFNTPTRREIAPFLVIEYRCLVWPLRSTESSDARRREVDWCRSVF